MIKFKKKLIFSSFKSDITSVSRQRVHLRNVRKIIKKKSYEAEDTWEEMSQISRPRSSSIASTSFRLIWQGEQEWEDEFRGIFLI